MKILILIIAAAALVGIVATMQPTQVDIGNCVQSTNYDEARCAFELTK